MDASFTKVIVDGGVNWIKLKPGMDKAAVFLETHRCANLKGASMGFTKLEGTTVNAIAKIAYSALQNIQSSMVRGNAAWRDSTNVAADKGIIAGGVFAHNLAGGQRDLDGTAMSSDWVPVQTKTLLIGEDIAEDALGNVANPDKVSSPDNLKFSEKLRTLFIGEDRQYPPQQFSVGVKRGYSGASSRDLDSRWRRINRLAHR